MERGRAEERQKREGSLRRHSTRAPCTALQAAPPAFGKGAHQTAAAGFASTLAGALAFADSLVRTANNDLNISEVCVQTNVGMHVCAGMLHWLETTKVATDDSDRDSKTRGIEAATYKVFLSHRSQGVCSI